MPIVKFSWASKIATSLLDRSSKLEGVEIALNVFVYGAGGWRWGDSDKKATARSKSRTIVLLLYTALIAIFSYMYREA